MATVRIPVSYLSPNKPSIPVTISNGSKQITINMLIDTGWEQNQIESKYARLLGYTPADILSKSSNQNTYEATVKIGSLKPIETILNISTANTGLNVFGALWMRQYDSFVITRSSVTVTDSTIGGTMEGLLELTRDWNKYLHGIVGGPQLAATTATKKQALFAASNRSNSSAYWRNRM